MVLPVIGQVPDLVYLQKTNLQGKVVVLEEVSVAVTLKFTSVTMSVTSPTCSVLYDTNSYV